MCIDFMKRVFLKALKFLQNHPVCTAFFEVAFTVIVSNAALAFSVFVYIAQTENAFLSYDTVESVIANNVKASEVLVYLLALVAPTLWIMVSHWRARKHVSLFWTLFFVQIIIIICSSWIYGAAKSGLLKNDIFVNKWAISCLIVALLIWYATLVYQKIVLDKVSGPSYSSAPESGSSILAELENR